MDVKQAISVVWHVSASGFGNAALIDSWHRQKGWNGIGYSYVILNGWIASGVYNSRFDGHVETGRPLDSDPFLEKGEFGAHVKGWNKKSVGICFIGKSGKLTDSQLFSGLELTWELEKQFKNINLFQHSELDPVGKPNCAGLDMGIVRRNYSYYKEQMLKSI